MSDTHFARLQELFPDVDPLELYVFAASAVQVAKRAVELHGAAPIRAALQTDEGMASLLDHTGRFLTAWQQTLAA